jgi:hypothetical protein
MAEVPRHMQPRIATNAALIEIKILSASANCPETPDWADKILLRIILEQKDL